VEALSLSIDIIRVNSCVSSSVTHVSVVNRRQIFSRPREKMHVFPQKMGLHSVGVLQFWLFLETFDAMAR
jgi:hypothetical protein